MIRWRWETYAIWVTLIIYISRVCHFCYTEVFVVPRWNFSKCGSELLSVVMTVVVEWKSVAHACDVILCTPYVKIKAVKIEAVHNVL